MMAKPLILVKHSLPEILAGVPACAWYLSESGRVCARLLAEKLIEYQPEIIISSVEPKARETAQILAECLGLEFQEVEGLHEHDRSKSPFYSKHDFQRLVQEFFEKPNVLVFGDETAAQTLVRFRQAVDSVLISYADKAILIVAHGTVISVFASWLTGYDGYHLWKELGLPSFAILDLQSKILLEIDNLP